MLTGLCRKTEILEGEVKVSLYTLVAFRLYIPAITLTNSNLSLQVEQLPQLIETD